jgi:(p)ppGpp synthase/HD superfamily hydrolase
MPHSLKKLTDYLVSLGTDRVPHTGTRFLSHLIGVYKDLKEWGCPEHVVLAGLFHSIYGTEVFQGFALPTSRRGEVRELIGEQAERLAYINCALTRQSLDASVAAGGPPRLWDRFEDRPLELSEEEYTDLLTLHLCDRLEQVGRSQNWDVRRQAWENMARRLGGVALESWERVYAGQ